MFNISTAPAEVTFAKAVRRTGCPTATLHSLLDTNNVPTRMAPNGELMLDLNALYATGAVRPIATSLAHIREMLAKFHLPAVAG